jgi:sarcosine oxidase
MKREYDTIVLGCGGLGSAALYWLSRRIGPDALGLEQFRLSHDYGASRDHSRIIRLSYDDPAYTRLTPYAYIAWRDLEDESGIQLVLQTGGLVFGPGGVPAPSVIDNYAQSMKNLGIPFEALSPQDAMRRFPQFRMLDGDQILYQAFGGLVDPGKASAVHATLARARGATILEETAVQRVIPTADGVHLETSAGDFDCRRLVVTSGGWTNKVLSSVGISLPLTVTEEQVTYFATPHLRLFSPDRCPIWIYHGQDAFYGFPVYGEVATKAGQDVGGDAVTVDSRRMQPNPRPLSKLQAFLQERIPDFLGPVLYTKPCLYTLPPDRGFILDTVPGLPQISVAVGAGHSFKFASLIGRILSDLAVDGSTVYPIAPFSLSRPAITDPNFKPTWELQKG